MTQEKVAEALDVSPVTLSRWINGHADPSFDKLDRLATATGRPISLTFGRHEEAAPPDDWAERLMAGVFALEAKAEISADELADAQARVAAYLAVARRSRPQRGGDGGAGGASA